MKKENFSWKQNCVKKKKKTLRNGLKSANVPWRQFGKGTLNGDFFVGYVEYVLAPTLNPGDIVVMDNCSPHKTDGVLDPIYEKGATVLFLPPYSPDLNPIELMFSKIKSILCKLKPRSFEDLVTATGEALDSVTINDIIGWFKYHGYTDNL